MKSILKDVNGNPLEHGDMVKTLISSTTQVVIRHYDGLFYLNNAYRLTPKTIRDLGLKKVPPTDERFTTTSLEYCSKCDIGNCPMLQGRINPCYTIVDRSCQYYSEYFLLKLKKESERKKNGVASN